MKIHNDSQCGWLNNSLKRNHSNLLNENDKCDYLIIGAGYTGLSAARKLSEIDKNKKIIIVDAQLAGEGASARNSGYLVDNTLNDGFTSNTDFEIYKKKIKIYELGIKAVKNYIKQYQVDCDWNECGKFFASSDAKDENKAYSFSKLLSNLGFENELIYKKT